MRAMLLSFVAMAVISVGAYYALHSDEVPFSSAEKGTTDAGAVRLD